jgi:hypothetical protein
MKSATCSQCRECAKAKRGRALCFPVPVSRLEQGLGHEKFKCELCGATFKLIPSTDGNVKLKRLS